MTQCASECNNFILKVKEGYFKVINDEFGANVMRLGTMLKIVEVVVGQVENIKVEIGVPQAIEEPRPNTLNPYPNVSSTDQV